MGWIQEGAKAVGEAFTSSGEPIKFDNPLKDAASKSSPSLAPLHPEGVIDAQNAIKAQQAQASQMLADMQANPITAGQVSAPAAMAAQASAPTQQIGTTPIVSPEMGNASLATAAQMSPAAQAQAMLAGAPQQVAGSQVGGGAQIGQVGTLTPAQIQDQQQAEVRAKQMALATQLEGQAAGTAPSLAQQQLKQANDRAIAQQMALAGMARGGNVSLAQRNAAVNTANLQQTNAQSAAQLKLQEQQQAQQQLGTLYGNTREADVTLAQKQAELAQQAGLTNFTTAADTAKAQAGLNQEANIQQAQLSQQAQLANQTAAVNTALENAKLGTSVNMANVDAINKQVADQANLQQQAILANQQAINQRTETIAKLQQDAAIQNRQITSQEQQTIAKMQQELSEFNADLQNKVALANQDAELKTKLANQAADLTAKGMQADQVAKMMGISQDALVAVLQSESGLMAAKAARDATRYGASQQMAGAGIGAAGAIAAAAIMASDRKLKKNIKRIGYFEGALVRAKGSKKAEVSGDSKKNDKVDVKVSEGELIVPRSVVQDGPDAIRDFAAAILKDGKDGSIKARNGGKYAKGCMAADGGMSIADLRQSDDSQVKEVREENEAADRKKKREDFASAMSSMHKQPQTAGEGMMSAGLDIGTALIKSNASSSASQGGVVKRDEIHELLDNLSPYSYEYKDPKGMGAAEGTRFGIMAQDLEKSDAGRSIVMNTQSGKMVDTKQGLGLALAAMAAIHQRLKKVESKK